MRDRMNFIVKDRKTFLAMKSMAKASGRPIADLCNDALNSYVADYFYWNKGTEDFIRSMLEREES